MGAEIKVEGFKELRDRALKLDKRLQRKVYGAAVRAGGKVLVDAAQGKVPVRTGSVKASLVHRASSKPSQGLFGVKVTIKGGKLASARVAHRRGGKGSEYHPDAVERYYRFQELGTKHHAAQPFLKPAIEGNQSAVLNAVKQELAAGLEREARSL
ncbi:HK97-gp10 family putative phage morphogenesis protein [Luteolibacter soli]|uniref:HK97-gp10 family putative phage morphogenesis protein n=1 Tax=Luteolibacter soli TaxID=3135280 RepID=A0ABU9AYE6_9BACT